METVSTRLEAFFGLKDSGVQPHSDAVCEFIFRYHRMFTFCVMMMMMMRRCCCDVDETMLCESLMRI